MNKDVFKMSLEALSHNKVRSVLTALGIIIGTAIIIIVLSAGAGIRTLILEQIGQTITADTLWVEVQVPSEGTKFERDANTASSIGMGVQITTLKNKDFEDVLKLPNIRDGYRMVIGQAKLTYRENEKTTMIFGVDSAYAEIDKLPIAEGRYYTPEEDESLANVVVLGAEAKKKLFNSGSAVGKDVKIGGNNYQVVGVLDEIGTKYFINIDEIVYIPLQTTQKKIMGIDYIMGFAVLLEDVSRFNITIDQIEKRIRKNHNIRDPAKDDFVVRTLDEAMDIVDTVTYAISVLLFTIASISLIVGGVGIMNVMYVAVSERTHEIGLKKAVGARPFIIRIQFIFEAVIISAIGGLFGIIFGIGISWLVSFVAKFLNFNWPFVMTLNIILFSFIIPVLIGLIFGIAPANKASRMNPIDALRAA